MRNTGSSWEKMSIPNMSVPLLILEKFPSLDECKSALFDMEENKSPGIDGLL